MKRIPIILILLLLLTAVPIGAAQAGSLTDRTIKSGQTVTEDVELFGGNLTLEKGATVDGNILVWGGNAEIYGDVTGSVSIFGGNAEITGAIDGDLVIFGGNMDVSDLAQVDGDCVLFGGNVEGEGASNVGCSSFGQNLPLAIDSMGSVPTPPNPPTPPNIDFDIQPARGINGFFRDVGEAASSSLMFGLLALILAALLPNHLNQVSDVIVRKPVASGTVGVLTAMAGPFAIALAALISGVLIILCGLGLLGFPIVLIMSIALGFGFLMGWIAMGTLLGQRLAEAMNLNNRSLPVVAALGTALLTLVTGLIMAMPFGGEFFGGVIAVIVGSAGLGAVALTKFGTRSYPFTLSNEEKVAAVLETLPAEEAE